MVGHKFQPEEERNKEKKGGKNGIGLESIMITSCFPGKAYTMFSKNKN